jgi:hypothetical protein
MIMEKNFNLEGIGAKFRESHALRAGLALVAAGSLLTACGLGGEETGVVRRGADGQNYVLPDGAQRPVYANKQDCIDDVNQQIKQAKEAGEKVDEKPEDLCEPTERYVSGHSGIIYARGSYYGPVVGGNSGWQSPRVQSWQQNIGDGQFAAKGAPLQKGISVAPKGSVVGSKTSVRGGFGGSAKGGGFHGSAS